MDLKKLQEPFPADAIEWRIGRAGKSAKGLYAKVLAYLTNRAIMQRLDDVCGPENWANEYKAGPAGGILCGISIRINANIIGAELQGQWVTKWDGAENTDVEAIKGGLSDAMKRAAVQWGVGRYLYDLGETFAECSETRQSGWNYAKSKEVGEFYWKTPLLPDWALPPPEPKKADAVVPPPKPLKTSSSSVLQQSRIMDLCKELQMDVQTDICTPDGFTWPLTFVQAEAVIKRLEQKRVDLAKELDKK